MKLRNKKTGKVYTACRIFFGESLDGLEKTRWKTLAEFNEDWEDYEDEEYWFISPNGAINISIDVNDDIDKQRKQIGNYFKTEEGAEKAVEKLKALERLSDNNLRFRRGSMTFVNTNEVYTTMNVRVKVDTYNGVDEDLDLLFGGEE